jgi:hypothetical protein
MLSFLINESVLVFFSYRSAIYLSSRRVANLSKSLLCSYCSVWFELCFWLQH